MGLMDPLTETIVRLNRLVRRVERLEARKPHVPVCLASRTGAYSHTSSGSWVEVPFDAEIFDPDERHSTVTNNTDIVISVPGVYTITGGGDFATSGAGTQRGVRLTVNNTSIRADLGGVTTEGLSASRQYKLAASDVVSLEAYQDTGGSLNLSNASLEVVLVA